MKTIKFLDQNYLLKESWYDVTLNDYNSLQKDDSLYNCLSILTGISKDDIIDCPVVVLESFVKESNWFWETKIPKTNQFTITINNTKHAVRMDNLSFGQQNDAHLTIQNKNISKTIAIFLCPPVTKYSEYTKGEIYEVEKQVLNASIVEVMSILDFFLLGSKKLPKNTTLYSKRKKKKQPKKAG
mgnify:FL=1